MAEVCVHLGLMFSWATRDYLLDCMSIEQVVYYYNTGCEAQKSQAQVFWGVLGEALSDKKDSKKPVGIEELRKLYPDGTQTESGYTVTR